MGKKGNRVEAIEGQVARIGRLDAQSTEAVAQEVMTLPQPQDWVLDSGEHQSGGWWTCSLLNTSGDPRDVTLQDCDPAPTTLLERMPATRTLLESLGLRYMWARLARLEAKSFLWEHRDYGNLSEAERHRLHIPLHTNPSAYLVTRGAKVHMYAGHMWRLTPTHQHGVCNLDGPDRIHLLLDCYADDAYRSRAATAELLDGDVEQLPDITADQLAEAKTTARRFAEGGDISGAENRLLRLFYLYALPEGRIYDLVMDLHRTLGREQDVRRWREHKRLALKQDAA